MKNRSVFVGELSWPEYDRLVREGAPLLLPIGSLEQHGHHMSMNVDVLLPTAFCERVAKLVGGLVGQPFIYGYKSQVKSGGGNYWPGTTSLDGATMVSALKDVIKEYARHGIRNIALMNGHYENSWFIVEGVDLALRELRWDGVTDMKIILMSYWDFVTEDAIAKLYPDGFTGWDIEHGGVLETSLMLVLHPDLVDLDAAIDHPPAEFPPYDVYPAPRDWVGSSGTLSSPKNASYEKGEILLKVCTQGITDALATEFPNIPNISQKAAS